MKRWTWTAVGMSCVALAACGEGAPDDGDDAAVPVVDAGDSDGSLAPDGGADAELDGYAWALPIGLTVPPRVPADNPMSEEKVQLGRHLFYDKRLSGNNTQSCASCHDQAKAFTDGRATGLGSTGESHTRGSMSLANVGYFSSFTWANNKLLSLEAQALVPLFGIAPVELGASENDLMGELRVDTTYQAMFPEAFPDDADPYTVLNLVRAIASFERTLLSGSSPYDRWFMLGEADAISEAAQRGAMMVTKDPSNRFECNHCHGGDLFSNSVSHTKEINPNPVFFNNGLYNLNGRGDYPGTNRGLMDVSLDPADMGKFKPPSLRNIALTEPFMHDGTAATLDDVIDHYSRGGRYIMSGPNFGDGRESPPRTPDHGFDLGTGSERGDLKAFLESLTDQEFITDPRYANPWPAGSPAFGTPET